jgi:hypothetical protein
MCSRVSTRQWRDSGAAMAGKTDGTDNHRPQVDPALAQILHGGHDLPTRLQLLRAWFEERIERQMRRCQAGWEATRNPTFILEAQALIDIYRRPPPPWYSEAVIDLAMNRRSKEHVTRAHNALIRRRRFEAVIAAKAAGKSWKAAYAEAARVLAETPWRGSADSMKAAYIEVARDIREGRGDQYITPPNPDRILRHITG